MEPATKAKFVMDAQGRSIWSPSGEVPQAAVAEVKQGKSASSKKADKVVKNVAEEKRMISLPKHLQSILQAAAEKAMPELKEEVSVVP